MLKKKYIKRIYVEIAICDKCGAELRSTGICLNTYPAKYPYECSNPNCDGHETFQEGYLPGALCYEYEEDESV